MRLSVLRSINIERVQNMSKKICDITIRIPVYVDDTGRRVGCPETSIPAKIGGAPVTRGHPDLDSAVREVKQFVDGNEIKLP